MIPKAQVAPGQEYAALLLTSGCNGVAVKSTVGARYIQRTLEPPGSPAKGFALHD